MKKLKIIILIAIAVATGIIIRYSVFPAKADIYGSSLVGWWRMDTNDDLNGVTMDRSGNGNNGNLVNIATSTFYSYGKIGQGFLFDGTDDYVNTGNNASLAPSSALTISGWINSLNPTQATSQAMVQKTAGTGVSGNYLCRLQATTGKIRFAVNTGTEATYNASTTLNADKWYHVACVWDGTDMRIYLNGASDGTPLAKTGTMADNGANFNIGRNGGTNGLFFNGRIDDVRIYNRALSAGEVAQLYNMGMTQFNSFSDF